MNGRWATTAGGSTTSLGQVSKMLRNACYSIYELKGLRLLDEREDPKSSVKASRGLDSAVQRWPPYNSVNGSTSITSAVALHFLSRANACARRNNSLSAVRLAALIRN